MPPKNKKKKSKTPEQKAEAEARRKQANRQANMERSGPTPQDLGEEKKEEGNTALAAGDLPGAIALYTQAIQHDHSNHVYWSNRSAALLKQGDVKGAISDGEMCVEINPGWGKGYARLGTALFQNGEKREAERVYKEGLLKDPRNKTLLEGLIATEQTLNPGASADEIAGRVEKIALDNPDLAVGTTVSVDGLVGAAEHNGKEAVVESFDKAKGRYVVKLSTGESVALKPDNLTVVASGDVAEVKVSSKVIGIDLGTTNSCVGVWINDEVQILTSPEGRKTVPSFVAFDGDRRLVGDEAKSMQTRNIANTVYDAKRIIGQQMSNQGVMSDIERFQYKVKTGASDKPVIEVDYQGRKKSFAPEEISAMVLVKMKEIAEEYLGEQVTRAVITVPAYFGDGQRAATQAAGRIAGLTVERIINEPTAAALAYGLDKLSLASAGEVTNVLVFDLGGGTFDVSILKIEDGIFEVLATGGDTRLGGEDFDLAIVDYLLKVCQKEHKKSDLKDNPRAVKRLKVAAQEAKEALSSVETYTIQLDGLWEGHDFTYELTKVMFEKLIEPWSKIALETVKKVMRDSKLAVKDISEVVMVGGSTRVPKMQADLREFMGGKELCKEVNPDECVAYGAAVQGAILGGERSDKTSALLLVDVTPLSLGVEVEGKAMSTIVKRNTPIPCVKKGMYTTVEDFQTSIDINIYEGERSHVEGNTQLGEFVISGIERGKRDTAKVEVSFEIDTNGILKVSARDKVTMVENQVVIDNAKGRLSTDEVDAMVAEAEKYAAEDAAFTERLAARNQVEKLAYDLLELGVECEIEKLVDKAKEVRAWCDEVSITGTTPEYNAKRVEMETLMTRLGVR